MRTVVSLKTLKALAQVYITGGADRSDTVVV